MAIVRIEYQVDIIPDPDPHPVLEYTANLAKTVLAKASPEIARLYAPKSRGPPKPVAITPPLDPETLQPVASLLQTPRRPSPEEFKPALLRTGEYKIHLTIPSSLTTLVPQPGVQVSFHYKGANIRARIRSAKIIATTPPSQVAPTSEATIQFLTPYLPKDPYIHSKYSSFNLAPDTTFSIPAYIHVKTVTPKRRFHKTLETLRKCLILPHTGYCRLKKTWYLKRTKHGRLQPIPALTGRLVYMVNTYECTLEEQLLTTQIIHTAYTTGIGKSRANGFGILHPSPNTP